MKETEKLPRLKDFDTPEEYLEHLRKFNATFIEDDDVVNSPSHYEVLPGVEVYDIREAILSKYPTLHPCIVDDWSRSWEYLTRMFGKNGLEDAKKARWYLNKLIERMEDES